MSPDDITFAALFTGAVALIIFLRYEMWQWWKRSMD